MTLPPILEAGERGPVRARREHHVLARDGVAARPGRSWERSVGPHPSIVVDAARLDEALKALVFCFATIDSRILRDARGFVPMPSRVALTANWGRSHRASHRRPRRRCQGSGAFFVGMQPDVQGHVHRPCLFSMRPRSLQRAGWHAEPRRSQAAFFPASENDKVQISGPTPRGLLPQLSGFSVWRGHSFSHRARPKRARTVGARPPSYYLVEKVSASVDQQAKPRRKGSP